MPTVMLASPVRAKALIVPFFILAAGIGGCTKQSSAPSASAVKDADGSSTCNSISHPEGPTTLWQYSSATCSCRMIDNTTHQQMDGGTVSLPAGTFYDYNDSACTTYGLAYDCSKPCENAFFSSNTSSDSITYVTASATFTDLQVASKAATSSDSSTTKAPATDSGDASQAPDDAYNPIVSMDYAVLQQNTDIYSNRMQPMGWFNLHCEDNGDGPELWVDNAQFCGAGYQPDSSYQRQSRESVGLNPDEYSAPIACI